MGIIWAWCDTSNQRREGVELEQFTLALDLKFCMFDADNPSELSIGLNLAGLFLSLGRDFGGGSFYDGYITAVRVEHFILRRKLRG